MAMKKMRHRLIQFYWNSIVSNTDFDVNSPKELPLGSCIHCGGNIWQSDSVGEAGWHLENNKLQMLYECKRCKQLVTTEELIPF